MGATPIYNARFIIAAVVVLAVGIGLSRCIGGKKAYQDALIQSTRWVMAGIAAGIIVRLLQVFEILGWHILSIAVVLSVLTFLETIFVSLENKLDS
ncbi:hypothetical protein ACOJIV_28095 [Haloarcula sp. AONF1]